MLYQVCVLNKATKGTRQTVTATELITAETISQATRIAESKHDRASFRVYPYCTPQDGEGQMELARHTLRSVENWERRNDFAAMEPYKRTQEDREDFISISLVTFAEIFAENPSADMFTLSGTAFTAINAEKMRRARNSEREVHPDFTMNNCGIAPRRVKATRPALDNLLRKAISTTDFTDRQMVILNMWYDGISAISIAEDLKVTRKSVYDHLYRSYVKLIAKMVELDADLQIFTEAGITAEDIESTLAIYRERTRKR